MNIFFPEKNIDPACQYCGVAIQSRKHLFQECPNTLALRNSLEKKIFREPLSQKEWAVGTTEPEENLVIWTFLKYIYDQNHYKRTPSYEGIASTLAEMRAIERENARDTNRMGKHLDKWEKVENLIRFGRKKNRWD